MAKQSTKTEREYNLTGSLSDNPGDLEHGEVFLRFDFHRPLKRVLRGWLNDKTKLEFSIHAFRLLKSQAQLGYYFGVVIPMVRVHLKEQTGETFTTDQLHLFHMMRVLGDEPIFATINGVEITTFSRPHVRSMTTKEFAEMTDVILAYWDERGLYIPPPKKNTNNNLTDYLEDD